MVMLSRLYKVLFILCFSVTALSSHGYAQEANADIAYIEGDLKGVIEAAQDSVQGDADNVLTLDTAVVDEPFLNGDIIEENTDTSESKIASINPNNMRSLMYNAWEHAAVNDALSARDHIDVEAYRKRTLGGEPSTTDGVDEFGADKPAEIDNSLREISLSGILYTSKKDWTIWLNGQRVTPNSKPEEVVGIKVFKDYIELKWFDKKSLQIYPIRLRSHQRFNLDNNLFLPG